MCHIIPPALFWSGCGTQLNLTTSKAASHSLTGERTASYNPPGSQTLLMSLLPS